jgi:hypothetical protein
MNPTRLRTLRRTLMLVACSALLLTGCSVVSGGSASVAPRPPDARRYTDSEIKNLILPRGSVPAGLTSSEAFLLSNETVASLLDDPGAARLSMERAGRVQGAAREFDLQSGPRAGEKVVTVISTVSWYNTAEGAESVIADPTMELVLYGLGLQTAEIQGPRIGQQSRVFRGFRDGDQPDLAAYVALFRRLNLIGAVVVVVPAATDDGGRLAIDLARKQAAIPLPSAAP